MRTVFMPERERKMFNSRTGTKTTKYGAEQLKGHEETINMAELYSSAACNLGKICTGIDARMRQENEITGRHQSRAQNSWKSP